MQNVLFSLSVCLYQEKGISISSSFISEFFHFSFHQFLFCPFVFPSQPTEMKDQDKDMYRGKNMSLVGGRQHNSA